MNSTVLAIELAGVAKSVGLRQGDREGLKALVKSLGVRHAEYAEISKTYDEIGWDRLTVDVANNWRMKPPEIPNNSPQAIPNISRVACYSFLLKTDLPCGWNTEYLISNLRNKLAGEWISLKDSNYPSLDRYDLLIETTANPLNIAEVFSQLSHVDSVEIRDKSDFGTPDVDIPELQWEATGV